MMGFIVTALALVALVGSAAQAQADVRSGDNTVHLPVRGDSRLWIEGRSNLHDWSCEATHLEAAVDVARWIDDRDFGRELDAVSSRLRRVFVTVPVTSLKCGRDHMDRLMYRALRADELATAREIRARFDVVSSDEEAALALQTVGTLRVAGQEQAVRLEVHVERLSDGTLRAQGALPIRMTDYGIDPPTALLGLIRADSHVVVKFDLFVDRQATMVSGVGQR